jgi:hypothetical protein
MEMKFEVEFLPDAVKFMNNLENKAREKIYYNIRKAQITKDTVLFKKLTPTLWEFRTLIKHVTVCLLSGIRPKKIRQ